MKETVLVTGSSRGIGRAVALKFASCGYRIVINCARSTDRLEEVKKEVEALGAECLAVQADVGNSNDCQRLFKEIEARFGHVNVLVNNAGISIIGLLQDLSFEDWNRILSANLSSVFHCAKLAIPGMIHNHSGKIINISSVGASAVPPARQPTPPQKAVSTVSPWLSQKSLPPPASR